MNMKNYRAPFPEFPVITLHQPWASWIMMGFKTIETRTHNRFQKLVGQRILIHAGLKFDETAEPNSYLDVEQLANLPETYPQGAILGSAYVSRFERLSAHHSRDALIDCENVERYGLFLPKSELTVWDEPVPVKGERGIWYFDAASKQKVPKPKIVTV